MRVAQKLLGFGKAQGPLDSICGVGLARAGEGCVAVGTQNASSLSPDFVLQRQMTVKQISAVKLMITPRTRDCGSRVCKTEGSATLNPGRLITYDSACAVLGAPRA